MKYNIIEIFIGFAFIVIATFFGYLLFDKREQNISAHYTLSAQCDNAEGISEGSDIKIAGIKIGFVEAIELDEKNYYATLTMKILDEVKLPVDSDAAIVTSGFLGNRFIAVTPGASSSFMTENATIPLNSAMNLENIINKVVYSFTNKAATSN